ncbi:MAG TPA: hypothetical protein PKH23_04165 [Bacillota bacterium]|nr:hypothetical protein [Bacillota bacterium]
MRCSLKIVTSRPFRFRVRIRGRCGCGVDVGAEPREPVGLGVVGRGCGAVGGGRCGRDIATNRRRRLCGIRLRAAGEREGEREQERAHGLE